MSLPTSAPAERPAAPDTPLSRTVLLTRNVLPVLIALVVLAYEELFVPLGNASFARLAHLSFYGLAGPLVTFFTIQWIADGIKAREAAEHELRGLYAQLSASHERLSALQHLMRAVSEPADLETLLDVAVRGTQAASGAVSVRASLRGDLPGGDWLGGEWAEGGGLSRQVGGAGRYQVNETLRADGEHLGELQLSFETPPSSDTRELVQAISSELGSAIISTQRRTRDLISLFEVDQSIRAERNMRRLAGPRHRHHRRAGAGQRPRRLLDGSGRVAAPGIRPRSGRRNQKRRGGAGVRAAAGNRRPAATRLRRRSRRGLSRRSERPGTPDAK